MSRSKSILIIGGGVIGLCTAYYAAQRGHRVTVVERGAPDHDCCSLGNAGMIVPSHFVPLAAPGMVSLGLRMMLNPESPFWIRPRLSRELLNWSWRFFRAANAGHVKRAAPLLRDLHLASRKCFERLAEQFNNDFDFATKGLLMLCKTQRALHEETETAKMARDLGLPAQVLTSERAIDLLRSVRVEIAGAVYYQQDCHLTPQRFVASMTRVLQQNGVAFEWSTEVIGWRATSNRIEAVRTQLNELVADEFVIAGGSWSPQIARTLRLNLPMQAGKGYSLTLSNPPCRPNLGMILVEARVAVTPMGSSVRFGGTMELAGLDESIDQRRVQGIIKSIPPYLPDFQPDLFRDVPVWRGLRPCSPDGLPYIGRTRRYSNLAIATGHAMMGVSLGPVTGKLMAEVLSNEKPSIDLSMLSPDRYG